LTADDLAAAIGREVTAALTGGPQVLVATVIATPRDSVVPPGTKMLVRRDGTTLGDLGSGPIQEAVLNRTVDAFRRHGVETVYLADDGTILTRQQASEVAAYQVMLEVHERPATLLIIGGGHIGKALAVFADLCGFSVEVIDDRPEYANRERFPQADRISQGRFDEVLDGYPIDANTYVVCVTRGHKHDETSLRLVAESPAAYVGMIGSRRRVNAVLQHLLEDGVDPEAASRVHTPIGLDIGAETPEEIAVAIMAEIIMARRGGTGGPMMDLKGARRDVAPKDSAAD
jgi:xanthine dehydrogenase accessory factor